mmetsp:Transcript_98699/g.190589  ORF Transcript_98699/g.190589 Transcript_98699/m.190589 type:complete len:217 (-) Transcript_98699:53-703(-)
MVGGASATAAAAAAAAGSAAAALDVSSAVAAHDLPGPSAVAASGGMSASGVTILVSAFVFGRDGPLDEVPNVNSRSPPMCAPDSAVESSVPLLKEVPSLLGGMRVEVATAPARLLKLALLMQLSSKVSTAPASSLDSEDAGRPARAAGASPGLGSRVAAISRWRSCHRRRKCHQIRAAANREPLTMAPATANGCLPAKEPIELDTCDCRVALRHLT